MGEKYVDLQFVNSCRILISYPWVRDTRWDEDRRVIPYDPSLEFECVPQVPCVYNNTTFQQHGCLVQSEEA